VKYCQKETRHGVSRQTGQVIYDTRSILPGKWFAFQKGPLPSKCSLTHKFYFDHAALAKVSSGLVAFQFSRTDGQRKK
jgi:hypothetical protein